MGIYSLGIGCIIITSVIAYLFLSVKRKNTKMHRIYGAMIITAFVLLLLCRITIIATAESEMMKANATIALNA